MKRADVGTTRIDEMNDEDLVGIIGKANDLSIPVHQFERRGLSVGLLKELFLVSHYFIKLRTWVMSLRGSNR